MDEQTMDSVLELVGGVTSPSTVLGGSAFNAIHAIAETRAGLRLGYVGVAGRVPVLGMSALRQLEALGVDAEHVLSDAHSLCGVCFSFAEGGERTLLTHAGANARMADYLRESFSSIVAYLARARVIHVTSFLDDETAGRLLDVLDAVKARNPLTRISFDPGHVWSTAPPPEIDGLLALSDYLLVNYREFRELGGGDEGATDDDVASRLLGRLRADQPAVLVKRPSGVHAYRVERGKAVGDFYPQLPLAQDEIEDATGAGDVFAAGLLTVLASDRLQVELGSLLGMRLARHKLRYVGSQGTRFEAVAHDFIASLDSQRRVDALPRGVFIAHGASPEWVAAKLFIEERLNIPAYSFESSSWGGHQVTEALTDCLDRCSFAICVLTAEDLTEDGRRLARRNVVHEVGLFQGRYGFDRVLMLVEDGCDFVPPVAEPYALRFPRHAVQHTFYQLEAALAEKGLGHREWSGS
ncbi:PfkB family carbohydrate kinase [Streptomyces sp. JJ36]|uniref:PfkB family carbohydrate kinase n=1 Tax=Streptomyces sp. JJ36 TaxID=2736645 RepID=UPI001F48EDDC|nr:PfkB family carbohydrate kinase [Streptomyces sp. JJ36]